MTKSFIAVILAAALTLTSFSAAPARADTDDVAKVLLGLAVIAGIAAVADQRRDRRRARAAQQQQPRYDYSKVLPQRCLRTFDTYNGQRQGFGRRCLERRAGHIDLPRRCERRVITERGHRTIYPLRCMRRQGFVVAGRHN